MLLASPLLNQAVRTAEPHPRAFAAVQTVAPMLEGFTAALSDRLTESYHPLLELCRLLTESLACGATPGTSLRPSFLIDMESRVFERDVTQGVAAAFRRCGPLDVSVQPLYRANQPTAGQPDIQLRPDVVVHGDGRPLLVVDAKWKRLLGSPLVTPDLYQVLAYCTTLPVRRAVRLSRPSRSGMALHACSPGLPSGWRSARCGSPVRARRVGVPCVAWDGRCAGQRGQPEASAPG